MKKIEIRSIDENSGKQIKGEASIQGSFGSGSKKMMGNSRQVFYEPGVKDASEAAISASSSENWNVNVSAFRNWHRDVLWK